MDISWMVALVVGLVGTCFQVWHLVAGVRMRAPWPYFVVQGALTLLTLACIAQSVAHLAGWLR